VGLHENTGDFLVGTGEVVEDLLCLLLGLLALGVSHALRDELA